MIWGAWKLWSQWLRAKIKAPACLADYRCNALGGAGGLKKGEAEPPSYFTSLDTTPLITTTNLMLRPQRVTMIVHLEAYDTQFWRMQTGFI
jgi:hypothetical protein